MTYWEIKN